MANIRYTSLLRRATLKFVAYYSNTTDGIYQTNTTNGRLYSMQPVMAIKVASESCWKLGSNAAIVDETGKQAVFYAAWYGHPTCVKLLLDAATRLGPNAARALHSPHVSPSAATNVSNESDIDMIPSLSLPPPAMPYRVYGHNFLDKANLVHVCIGHPFINLSKKKTAVTLSPRLMGPSAARRYPYSSPLFKLVMTCKPEIAPVPYTVSIPVRG